MRPRQQVDYVDPNQGVALTVDVMSRAVWLGDGNAEVPLDGRTPSEALSQAATTARSVAQFHAFRADRMDAARAALEAL